MKKSGITKCSKILDQTVITSSPNDQNAFKHSVTAHLRYSRGLNQTRFERNVVLTAIFKTIKDPLEIDDIELSVFLFRALIGHCTATDWKGSGCCFRTNWLLGEICLRDYVLHDDSNKAQKESNLNVNW